MAEILDFTDYAKPLDFKYQEVTYRIPAFNKKQLEKLMEINKQFGDVDIEEDITPKEDDAPITDEQVEKTKKFFEIQDDFISFALMKKDGDEYKEVKKSEIADWPVKVKNRVMKAISEQMSTSADEDEPEKKSSTK